MNGPKYLTQVAQTLIGQQRNPLHLFHCFYGEHSLPQQPLSPRRKKAKNKTFLSLTPGVHSRGGVSVGAVGAIAPTAFEKSLIVT